MSGSHITVTDAYALRRAMVKMEVPTDLHLTGWVKLLLALDYRTNPEHWSALQTIITNDTELMRLVLEQDPKAPPPPTKFKTDEIHVPALPREAQLTDDAIKQATDAGRWLDECMEWLTRRAAMSSKLFLEAGALYAVSIVIAGRMALNLDFGTIKPHLYVLIIATTTYYKKSTALHAVEDLVKSVAPHLLLASQNTPELLFFKLAGKRTENYDSLSAYDRRIEDQGIKFAAQRGIISDEATRLFSGKKYMEGLAEAFMEFYDGKKEVSRELRSEGKLIARDPALSIYGATTPARLKLNLVGEEWEDGLLARFALLTPTEKKIKRTSSYMAGDELFEAPTHLKAVLRMIYDALPPPPEFGVLESDEKPAHLETKSVVIQQDALEAFNRYTDALHDMTAPDFGLDERIRGNYGRLPIMALKIAINLAALDWATAGCDAAPVIRLGHWARAQLIVEKWRESVHRLLFDMSRSEDIKNEERIIDYLRLGHDKLPTRRDISVQTGIRRRTDCNAAIDALLEAGVIMEMQRKGERGPETVGYVLSPEYE